MAFNDDVGGCAARGLRSARRRVVTGAVEGFAPGRQTARVDLADGGVLHARLVVAADGARSKLAHARGYSDRRLGHRPERHRRHDRARARPPRPRRAAFPARRARSRSCRCAGGRSSIVWNESHADAKALLALDAEDFLRQLERRFTLKLGAIAVASPVKAFPLSFRVRAPIRRRPARAGRRRRASRASAGGAGAQSRPARRRGARRSA